MNNKTQSASADDGNPKGMPKGQSRKIEQMNNPSAMSGVKENRKTGQIRSGTAFLRKNIGGVKSDM